jgi:hypothetical protein
MRSHHDDEVEDYSRDGSGDSSTLATLRKWLHPSVTIVVVLFAASEIKSLNNELRDMKIQIAVNTERHMQGIARDARQDAELAAAAADINRRLDALRDDIRLMQLQIVDRQRDGGNPRR